MTAAIFKPKSAGIRMKMTIAVCSSMLIIAVIGVFLGYLWAFILMRDSLGADREKMALILSYGINEMINKRADTINGYASDNAWLIAARAKNLMYESMDTEAVQRYFSDMDSKWLSASPGSPLVEEYTKNEAARELSEIVGKDTDIVEIFITDERGGLVASSEKTSDFYQADEKWWQAAFNDGRGDVYIGEVEYDESASTMSISFAMPISKDGRVVGVCKAVVDFRLFIKSIEKIRIGRTGHAALIDKKGNILFHEGARSYETKIGAKELDLMANRADKRWAVVGSIGMHRKPMLVSWAMVDHPVLRKEGVMWLVIISQDIHEAFEPLNALIFQGILLLILLAIFVLPIGYILGGGIVRPIRQLQFAARRIAEGALDYRIELKTGDELEDLGDAFNKMSAELKRTMVSRDSLVEEVSARRKAEEEVRGLQKRVEFILGATKTGLDIINADFDLVYVDPEWRKVYGDYEGRKCYKYFAGRDIMCPGCGIPKTMETKKSVVSEEVLPKEENRPIQVITMPFQDEKGEWLVAEVNVDIAERKKAEERLRGALEESERAREVMTSMLDDNNQIREDLEGKLRELKLAHNMLVQSEKLASLGRLAADMAHEVNNPLMIISGIAQLLLMDESLNKELRNNLRIVHGECNRAKGIMQGLLTFARPSRDERRPVDINQSIESVVKILGRQFGLSNVKINTRFNDGLPPALADDKQFQEVVMNLLNNARDAMPEGGDIDISTSLDGGRLKIEIRDNGMGMDAETLARMFEPFYTTKEKGTGLGLPVCYGIIKAHNGELKFTSQPNKGTTAFIFLPAIKRKGHE